MDREPRILIIDHRADVICRIGYALYRSGYQTAFARSGTEGLARARADRPDLVVLGSGPDGLGAQLAQDASTAGVPVVLLNEEEAAAGCRNTLPQLVARVEERLAGAPGVAIRGSRDEPGRVVGFIGARGGAGTTTVALHVAQLLAADGREVIAAELSSSPGAFAGLLGETPLANLSHLLALAPEEIDRHRVAPLLVKHRSGLQVLYGPRWADEFREISPAQLCALLCVLGKMAGTVVLDLPRLTSPAVRAALGRCDRVVLVMEPDPACVSAAGAMVELMRGCGVAAEDLAAVVVHRAPGDEETDLGAIRRRLNLPIAGVVPYAPRSAAARVPAEVVAEIAGRIADE